MSLSHQIVSYLQTNWVWVHKGDLLRRDWYHPRQHGVRYMPETVGRTLRSLEEASIIAVKPDGKSVAYKWLPNLYRVLYVPFTERENNPYLIKFGDFFTGPLPSLSVDKSVDS